jgi:hypothetical protein
MIIFYIFKKFKNLYIYKLKYINKYYSEIFYIKIYTKNNNKINENKNKK